MMQGATWSSLALGIFFVDAVAAVFFAMYLLLGWRRSADETDRYRRQLAECQRQLDTLRSHCREVQRHAENVSQQLDSQPDQAGTVLYLDRSGNLREG